MAYFVPPWIQKRLLRFALSRLDLFEEDALDPDKLEIGWGRKSTVELNDIGLKAQRISSIVNLPAAFQINHAKISILRITVPADLRTSSIQIDIQDVEVTVDFTEKPRSQNRTSAASNKATQSKRKRVRSPGSILKTSGNVAPDDPEQDELPTPGYLATSFLAEAPREEKEQLEADLGTQSTYLQHSIVSNDSTDKDLAYGVGVGFNIPSFLTQFLKGVSDRLQAFVKNVSVKVTFEPDQLVDDAAKNGSEGHLTSPATLCLEIDELGIHAVSQVDDISTGPSENSGQTKGRGVEAIRSRLGKRPIRLIGVRGSLLSDSAMFAQMSSIIGNGANSPRDNVHQNRDQSSTEVSSSQLRISSTSTMPNTRDDMLRQSEPYSDVLQPDSRGSDNMLNEPEASTQSTDRYIGQASSPTTNVHRHSLKSPVVTANQPLEVGETSTQDLNPDRSTPSIISTAQEDSSSSIHDSRLNYSKHMHDALRSFREERLSWHAHRAISRSPPRSDLQRKSTHHQSSNNTSPTRHVPGKFDVESPISDDVQYDSTTSGYFDTSQTSDQAPTETPGADDLTASKIFSHEEAQSMYMSAVAESPASEQPLDHMRGHSSKESQHSNVTEGPVNFGDNDHEELKERFSIYQISRGDDSPSGDNVATRSRQAHPDFASLEGPREEIRLGKESSFDQYSEHSVTKQFLAISGIDVYVPNLGSGSGSNGTGQSTSYSSVDVNYSHHKHVPGAFSLYAEETATTKDSTNIGGRSDAQHGQPIDFMGTEKGPDDKAEIDIGEISICSDLPISKLIFRIMEKCQNAFKEDEPNHAVVPSDNDVEQSQKSLQLSIRKLRVALMESLPGAFSTNQQQWSSEAEKETFKDVLCALRADDLTFSADDIRSMDHVRLEVTTIALSFGSQDIVTFQKETALKASMHNIEEVRDKDICIEIDRSDSVSEFHVACQPANVFLDMVDIDNTLGSFGGLSSLIEIGSSIMSESTVIGAPSTPKQRQRAVRFDEVGEPPSERIEPAQTKVNIKVAGSKATLKGRMGSVALTSSPIKLIGRNKMIGLQIDDLWFYGPRISSAKHHPTLTLRIRDTRLRYLFSPEEHDLTRLISLLTPSNDKFEDSDDFLVDTLIRQRKKGAVLRAAVTAVDVTCADTKALDMIQALSEEISRLSAVKKYLPQESRPGLLTLATVDRICLDHCSLPPLGQVLIHLQSVELAHTSCPSLIALAAIKVSAESDKYSKLISEVTKPSRNTDQPMVMIRMIEDELEPTAKIKLWNVCFEYSAVLMSALASRSNESTTEDYALDLTASVATLREQSKAQKNRTDFSNSSSPANGESKGMKVDLAIRDCGIGLKPLHLPSKAILVLTEARCTADLPNEEGFKAFLDLRKLDLLLIDKLDRLSVAESSATADNILKRDAKETQVSSLCRHGFVSISSISAATVACQLSRTPNRNGEMHDTLDVEFSSELLLLETCADSTQTLTETLSDLVPPAPPTKGQKYRTEIAPVEDMMASFTGDAFVVGEKDLKSSVGGIEDVSSDDESSLGFDNFEMEMPIENITGSISSVEDDEMIEALDELEEIQQVEGNPNSGDESIFGSINLTALPLQIQGVAKKWDSTANNYVPVSKLEIASCPVKVRVKDTHIIWNLYDGYDWQHTRDTITKAVEHVETRAEERRQNKLSSVVNNEDDESVIGDFLFNSIYIGVPMNHDPKDLSHQINRNIQDQSSETASQTPSRTSHASTATFRPTSSHRKRAHSQKLRLDRSKRHKIAFELKGVSVDFYIFQPGEETQSSTNIRVHDFEIFDHVPRSTWKKFATYMHDAGPREDKKPMLHLEVCDVKPVPDLTATELVLRATVLPLRLHVDQDALDFITRFFDFHDNDKIPNTSTTEPPYLQRVEVRPVPVKLDYKPKTVDYAGIRSGRTTEFMNFFILDGAEFTLKHVIIYGTLGFDKLHRNLEDVWMPDVKKNQLPKVLSGLNGVRTLVNVGSGFRDLVSIPIAEYKKDGRIVRSVYKGASAFVRNTGTEITRFGTKLAVGAQTALQGAEGLLAVPKESDDSTWEEAELEGEEKRVISHYAHQPIGILQGLKGAARSLQRDLLVTRDVIIAVSGEVKESRNAEGVARAVARHAPTLILRPMIGASKAVSQTLMGATNTVDPENRRRIEDKYKRY